jgi:hypothetical protein
MELYNRIKQEAKQKFDVYPSAYANGWLVQEYKRRGGKYKALSKGDYPGHPFRGNQWTGGISRGSAASSIRRSIPDTEKLSWATSKLTEKDVDYSPTLSEIAKKKGGIDYLSEGGSYYDYIDWDSDRDPHLQLKDMFEEYTGIPVKGVTTVTAEGSVEALAEVFDAITVLQSEWPGTQVGQINFDPSMPARNFAGAGYGSKNDIDLGLFVYAARSRADAVPVLNINSRIINEYEYIMQQAVQAESSRVWTRTQMSPVQSLIMHEWGHIVEQNMVLRAPKTALKIQHRIASLLDPDYKKTRSGYESESSWTGQSELLNDLRAMERAFGYNPSVDSVRGALRGTYNKAMAAKVRELVSSYGASKGAEVIAESFLMAWGNRMTKKGLLSEDQLAYAKAVRKIYNDLWNEAVEEGY